MSPAIGKKEIGLRAQKVLPVVEVVLYAAPIVFGFIPFPADYAFVTMIVAVVCVFGAISITFSGKGLQIGDQRANAAFGYLGGISLAIYLFHPVLISLFEYAGVEMPFWVYHLVIFASSLVAALAYDGIKRLLKFALNKKKTA